MFRLSKQIVFACLNAMIVSGLFANSVTIISTADTSLFEPQPNNNTGGNSTVVSGANQAVKGTRALIKFNLAGQIPSNASIQAVTLTLTCTQIPFTSANSTFDLHRMLVDWGEGTGSSTSGDAGRLAVAAEATWNDRFYPSTTWSSPGAASPADFSSTVSASTFVQDVGTYSWGSTAALAADVRQWLADSSTNFGWILISESENVAGTHRNFASRESTANNTPTLFVQYVIPVTPTIKSIQKVNGTIQFTFTALAGQPYTAQYRDSLTAGDWATLTPVDPEPSTQDVTVTDASPPPAQRFYRVTTTF